MGQRTGLNYAAVRFDWGHYHRQRGENGAHTNSQPKQNVSLLLRTMEERDVMVTMGTLQDRTPLKYDFSTQYLWSLCNYLAKTTQRTSMHSKQVTGSVLSPSVTSASTSPGFIKCCEVIWLMCRSIINQFQISDARWLYTGECSGKIIWLRESLVSENSWPQKPPQLIVHSASFLPGCCSCSSHHYITVHILWVVDVSLTSGKNLFTLWHAVWFCIVVNSK